MAIYNERKVLELYESSLATAVRKLAEIPTFCGNEPSFTGLRGWVFEQTIQYCLRRELKARKVEVEIGEQEKLQSRIKADLRIGCAAIEIKLSGFYTRAAITKYKEYRRVANALGLEYLFITGSEGYLAYRDGIAKALGKGNVFFLDTSGEWRRFIDRVVQLQQE
jgi:hypothetical protein